jgi:hypothetical protein
MPAQVTVAILLNSFVGAINAAEEEAADSTSANMKSKEMLRYELEADTDKPKTSRLLGKMGNREIGEAGKE